MLTSSIVLFFCFVFRLLSSQRVFEIQSHETLSSFNTKFQRLDFELRDTVSFCLLNVLSQTEISDEQGLILRVDKDVVRVDVSVDQSVAMDVLKGVHHLDEKLEYLVSLVLQVKLTHGQLNVVLQSASIRILHLNHH